ncbi:MAG: hypothetical protein ACR2NQ_01795 [Thermodesulfobacteriota bacterium]
MRRFILALVLIISVAFGYSAPSAAETGIHEMLGGSSVTVNYFSREYGDELAEYSRENRRMQGVQLVARVLESSRSALITETSYAQAGYTLGGRNLKTWVLDTSAKFVMYKDLNDYVKFFGGPSVGLIRGTSYTADASGNNRTKRNQAELEWGLNTGFELSQGRLSWTVLGAWNFADEFGNGAEIDNTFNFRVSDKWFISTGLGYDWNSEAVKFASGVGMHFY